MAKKPREARHRPYTKRYDVQWCNARKAYRYVTIFPGSERKALMRALGITSYGSLESLLCSLELYGFLCSEDDQGRIYPFGVMTVG